MATGKSWIADAAEEIYAASFEHVEAAISSDTVEEIIAKHSPFKVDVAYMPVPRCDSCRHWEPRGGEGTVVPLTGDGFCMRTQQQDSKMAAEMYDHIITDANFGCVQWEAK